MIPDRLLNSSLERYRRNAALTLWLRHKKTRARRKAEAHHTLYLALSCKLKLIQHLPSLTNREHLPACPQIFQHRPKEAHPCNAPPPAELTAHSYVVASQHKLSRSLLG